MDLGCKEKHLKDTENIYVSKKKNKNAWKAKSMLDKIKT